MRIGRRRQRCMKQGPKIKVRSNLASIFQYDRGYIMVPVPVPAVRGGSVLSRWWSYRFYVA
eukprot:scaffold10074_cov59-Attheya_sp.AAC.6